MLDIGHELHGIVEGPYPFHGHRHENHECEWYHKSEDHRILGSGSLLLNIFKVLIRFHLEGKLHLAKHIIVVKYTVLG